MSQQVAFAESAATGSTVLETERLGAAVKEVTAIVGWGICLEQLIPLGSDRIVVDADTRQQIR